MIRSLSTRAVRGLFVGGLTVAMVMAGAGVASGTDHAGVGTKKAKAQKVVIVVSDTEMPADEHVTEEVPATDEHATEDEHAAEDEHATESGEHEEHAPGSMSMTVSPMTVRHGKVKMKVTNQGTELHEMVVLKTNTPFDKLVEDANEKVSESQAVGEVPTLAKGKTKSLTLKLKAGDYVLVCNIHGHYAAGMRSGFTVT